MFWWVAERPDGPAGVAATSSASGAARVVQVGGGVLEPEPGVRRDGGLVVGLDVEDDPAYAEAGQVGEPGGGDRPAEPAALGGGVDGDDVDLAVVGVVLLGPVEGQQPVLGWPGVGD